MTSLQEVVGTILLMHIQHKIKCFRKCYLVSLFAQSKWRARLFDYGR